MKKLPILFILITPPLSLLLLFCVPIRPESKLYKVAGSLKSRGLIAGTLVHKRPPLPPPAPSEIEEEMEELRRGPWTVEEDLLLAKFVTEHGEGRWNALARCAGLKRTGKSCRLRWLNYLRPDVRRGNITAEEQLLILELHSRWGNRWSKIAQYLPGRTDNEIKNYWRTRVQKHAKQLRCDVNSKMFRDAMHYVWMPRLLERIRAANAGRAQPVAPPSPPPPPPPPQQPPLEGSIAATMDGQLAFSFSEMRGDEEVGHGGAAAERNSLSFPMSLDERGFWEGEEALLCGGFLWSFEDDGSWSMRK